jgi:serine/threonine-protein kinase
VRTKAGTFKGKVSYASKEQLANEPIDRRADVFAAGVLLWEGITGQRIAKDMDEPAILKRRFLGGEPYALDVNPKAARELADIAKKAMSPERDDRYATAAQMQAAIEAYIEGASLRVVDEDVGGFVAGLFAEQRSQVRKLVQERLAKPADGPTSSPSLLLPPPPSSSQNLLTSDSEPGATARLAVAAASGAVVGDQSTDVTVSLQTSPRSVRLRRRPVALLGLVSVLAVGLGLALVLRKQPAPRAEPAAAPPPSVSSAASVPDDPAGATAARLVDVTLTASPPSTRFWLDGRALEGNPFRGRLPRDTASHKLEARAPGFVAEERSVTLDGAVQVELALKAEAKAPPVAKPGRVGPADDGPSLRPTVPRTAKPIDTSDPYGGASR